MSAKSVRHRYLLGLLCHAALALVACHAPGGDAATPVAILASCGSSPSFVGATTLKRWKAFPVDVYVDLASIPARLRATYRRGIESGVRLWADASGERIGAFRVNFDRKESPVRVEITDRPLPERAIGSTELTYTENRVVSAAVRLARSPFEWTPYLWQDVASTTAHEFGHVLGIVDHSPHPDDKMWPSGNFGRHNLHDEPVSLLTPRDVNTLREAYCRP